MKVKRSDGYFLKVTETNGGFFPSQVEFVPAPDATNFLSAEEVVKVLKWLRNEPALKNFTFEINNESVKLRGGRCINAQKFLDNILSDCAGNVNKWWDLVEIVFDYMPPYPDDDEKPTKCSVKCGNSFLRDLGHGYFVWDIHYGEASEFHNPENALLALMNAPVPPWLLRDEAWGGIPAENRK
jgi:hypothetical protein